VRPFLPVKRVSDQLDSNEALVIRWRAVVRKEKLVNNNASGPLFFYVAHWYLLHVMALGAAIWAGASWRDFDFATLRRTAETARLLIDRGLRSCGGCRCDPVPALPCRWIGDLKRRTQAAWVRFI